MDTLIPVGISNRHLHVTQKDLYTLFGEGHELTNIKDLSQPGEFAAKETVALVGPKGEISKVRIIGPTRKETQVEITLTDSFTLGVNAPVRMSGDTKGSPGITLVGTKGKVELETGLIVAKRHVHMHTNDAKMFNVKDRDFVDLKTMGERSITLHEVVVRVSDNFVLDFHLDTDEANAAAVKNGDMVELVKIESRSLKLAQ